MSDSQWFVYQNNQQLGPFAVDQLVPMITSRMVVQEAFLFKVGWKDWRPIEECFDELGVRGPRASASVQSAQERRAAAPRASIGGRVIVHNNGQLIIGSGVNVSSTGIFVETSDQIFTVGEKLKITVRIVGFVKSFNVTARVIRFNSDPKLPVGFGLAFENLDKFVAEEIEKMVHSKRSSTTEKVG